MITIKSYIRSLNNKERKRFYNICFSSIFQSFSALFNAVLIKIAEIDILTLLCLQGSILSLFSFFRFLIDLHEEPELKDLLLNWKFIKKMSFLGLLIFLFFLMTLNTLNFCTMSTLFIISRYSHLVALLISKNEKFSLNEYLCMLFGLFGIVIVVLYPSYYSFELKQTESENINLNLESISNRQLKGVGYAFVAFCSLIYIQLTNEKENSKHADIQIFIAGLYSSMYGCIINLYFGQGIPVSFFSFILIFICSCFNFFGFYFKIKSLRGLSLHRKFIPFTLITIVISLIFGLVFFSQVINLQYSAGLLISLVNIYYFSILDSENRQNNEEY